MESNKKRYSCIISFDGFNVISKNSYTDSYIQPIIRRDTTAQWINDPNNGNEKYRMRINIEGFNQNEVIDCLYSITKVFFLFGNE